VESTKTYHILNLGAGVQSTALYLMFLNGEMDEALDYAVFADTKEEPELVYRHLEWLRSLGGPPILTDSAGKLGDDLIHGKKDEAVIQQTLDLINAYLDQNLLLLFSPVLDYLQDAHGIRTTSEIDEYFRKQVQSQTLSNIYEWLADKGVIQKVPSPVRLTVKSQITVDEAAYYYDGSTTEKLTGRPED